MAYIALEATWTTLANNDVLNSIYICVGKLCSCYSCSLVSRAMCCVCVSSAIDCETKHFCTSGYHLFSFYVVCHKADSHVSNHPNFFIFNQE